MAIAAERVDLRAQSKAETRNRVLASARAAFEHKGYQGATIRLIALAAGLSTGAVFSCFLDKRALYSAVYGHEPLTPEEGRALMDELAELRLAAAMGNAA